MLIPAWVLLTLMSTVELPGDTLECSALSTPLTSGRGIQFRINSGVPPRVHAVAKGQHFERTGPGHWSEIESLPALGQWTVLPHSSHIRLNTGQNSPVFSLDTQLALGLTDAGILEIDSAGAPNGPPVGLPFVTPRAVAIDPTDSNDALIAGDPEGLFLCTPVQCRRIHDGTFLAVAWFSDNTRFASDVDGGLWTYTSEGWTRHTVTEHPIVSISGVPDGGPRYLLDAQGASWFSEDHGRTWLQGPQPTGEVGPAGSLAVVQEDGSLLIQPSAGPSIEILGPGALPLNSTVRWVNPKRLVVGLGDGVALIDISTKQVHRLYFPVKQTQRLLDAGVNDEHLIVYTDLKDRNCFRGVSPTPPTETGAADTFSLGWPYIGGLLLFLGAFFLLVQRALRPRQESA